MKDFQKLKEYLEETKEIKTKDAIALGYSNYDLKTFLASSLLEKKARGVYALKAIEPVEAPSATLEHKQIPVETSSANSVPSPVSSISNADTIKNLSYEAIGHIFKKDYESALSKYETLMSLEPQNGYYDIAISYMYFQKENYKVALKYLLSSIDKQGETLRYSVSYLILCVLSKYVDIEPSVISSISAKINSSYMSRTFLYKVFKPIESGDYTRAQKNLYFFIKAEAKTHHYRLSNQYLYDILIDIIDKLGLEYIGEKNSLKQSGTESIENVAKPVAEPVTETVVVVPEINPKQILTNAILLQALEDGDYDAALQKVEEYEITDAKSIIISLINKLREAATRGASYLSEPTRVVSEEPAIVIPATIDESLTSIYPKEKFYPMIPEELLNAREESQDIPNEAPVLPDSPADADVYEGPLLETPADKASDPVAPATLEETSPSATPTLKTPEDYFVLYSDAMDCCDFDSAKRALFKYDTILKQLSNYQNIAYLFDRINRAREEYTRDPKRYQEKISLLNKVYSLMIGRKYDEALEVLSSLPTCQEKYLLSAELNRLLGNNDLAARQISLVPTTCQEPDYFRIQAELSFTSFRFQECLEYCIKYNERCPKENARIYILMADCYEKLKKPAKAAKVLRIADEINRANGSSKNLSGRITHNEQVADKNRAKRLSKLNKQEYDY